PVRGVHVTSSRVQHGVRRRGVRQAASTSRGRGVPAGRPRRIPTDATLPAGILVREGTTMPAIRVHDLEKRYGDVVAVDGLSFDVAEGEVFALLGPNGAGKTTTVEILEGYRDRDGGEVEVLGTSPASTTRSHRRSPRASRRASSTTPSAWS